MPFVSRSQQRAMHAKARRGEISQDTIKHWDEETKKVPGGFQALPEKVKKMSKKAFWSGFNKQASTPADAEAAIPDAQSTPEQPSVAEPQRITPPRAIQKFNDQGGVEARTPEELQIAESVNHVTLPKDVPEGGASCGTCVHFNPTAPTSGEGLCANPQVGLATTTKMVCSQWDSPGAHRAWDTAEVKAMQVDQMGQQVDESVDPLSESNMAASQMAEADPNMTQMGANPAQPKPQDNAQGGVSPEKKPAAKKESKPKDKEPAGTQVHVHVGSEKKASNSESIARIVGLLKKNPALLRNLAKGGALVGAGAVAGHAMTKKPGEEKQASLAHAVDLAGLGVLAAPTVQEMRGKPMGATGRHAAELGGLGLLAAPGAIALSKALKNKIPTMAKTLLRKA